MAAKQNINGIGAATIKLLEYADREGLALTVTPIVVELQSAGLPTTVTLHACRAGGADVQVRLGVDSVGIVHMALRREWDEAAGEMGAWGALDTIVSGIAS